MADVTLRYGANRKAEPLTEQEQDRLSVLAGKGRRSAAEQYELGGLKARARSDPAGRRLLDDLGHDQASRQTPVTTRQAGSAIAQAVAAAVAARLEDEEG
jgi:hypothetical protein